MSDGFFVVLEGPEGAGKSTLHRALVERLRAAGHGPAYSLSSGDFSPANGFRRRKRDG